MNQEIEKAQPPHVPTYAEIVLTPEEEQEAREKYPDLPEKVCFHRKRCSILAKRRHEVVLSDGRRAFGGPQPNPGPKVTKRMGEGFVDHFEKRQQEVLDAIAAPLSKDSDATSMERHRAGINIVKHIREERAMELVVDDYTRRTDEDIRRESSKMIAEKIRSGDITIEELLAAVASSTDDEVVDVELVPDA